MAYVKYKELTKYFHFNGRFDTNNMPNYVKDYLVDDEKIIAGYKTSRDKAVFTDKRMVLFDVTPFTKKKKIHILPYKSISTGAIMFKLKSGAILFSFDSGYQLRLDFDNLSAQDKTNLRLLFCEIMKNLK